jgi:hypothetical protein
MKLYNIIFTDPNNFSQLHEEDTFFTVTDNFYNKLFLEPKEYIKTEQGPTNKFYTNAYLFGDQYPINEYQYYGEHTNTSGLTSLIDYNLFEFGKYLDYSKDILEEPEIFFAGYNYQTLLEARKQIPALIFCGDTLGGDVGAALYVHYTNNKIDGLIIDNQYFFDTNGNIKKY